MRVGLVRHFKVKQAFLKKLLVGYDEVVAWFDRYDVADTQQQPIELGPVQWEACYASPAPRALRTAEHIFPQGIMLRDELKELNCLPLMNRDRRLPFILWAILLRNKSLSANEITDEFNRKLCSFIDELLATPDKNVLIVSHGLVMMCLQKELRHRGFKGQGFRSPANSRLYLFEK